ncbi:hypothetical protein F4805DRAFT_426403 [Annulohypoxylon moriforme]|nr:hypothetical protein F4805DRAFT_426403 [Annulohypoxylon moriforme]
MAPSTTLLVRLFCEKHSRLTCHQCLHSMNSVKDGFIPVPQLMSRIPCPEQAHSVEPVFGSFRLTAALEGFHEGLSPEDRQKYMTDLAEPQDGSDFQDRFVDCVRCGLTYISTGGRVPHSHPSHVALDGQRYICTTVEPVSFSRSFNKIQCEANFMFSYSTSKMNAAFACMAKSDSGSGTWNLDNAEIAVLVQLLRHVENEIIPYRKSLIEKQLYTNSDYFAGQASRFNLLVFTAIDKDLLRFLLRAHQFQYSAKRKAFVERNSLGIIYKRYPITEERHYQVVSFVGMINRLASLGIRVYWQHVHPDEEYIAAKQGFMHDPHGKDDFRDVSGVLVPNNEKGMLEEDDVQDLFEPAALSSLPSHEGYEPIERESPELRGAKSFEELYRED